MIVLHTLGVDEGVRAKIVLSRLTVEFGPSITLYIDPDHPQYSKMCERFGLEEPPTRDVPAEEAAS